jgi:hypothetical protein
MLSFGMLVKSAIVVGAIVWITQVARRFTRDWEEFRSEAAEPQRWAIAMVWVLTLGAVGTVVAVVRSLWPS